MVKPRKEQNIEEQDKSNASNQALEFLKQNKDYHYNFEDDNYYKVSSSSLNLNLELSGGLPVGAHRFIGITAGGKSSCSFDFMYNFLKMDKSHYGCYFKCEGRLSPELVKRTGIQFTTDASLWNNNCLVFETNVYEVVFGFIREMITKNPNKNKYFFIIDSVDAMTRREDLEKPFDESEKVAAGALLTSVFFKKTSAALAKRGHILIFISQLREEVKINQYQVSTPRQGKSSGGHAIEHGTSVVLDFLPRYNDDIIREDPADKNSKKIGHRCKIKIVKTDNENYVELSYPVKYGRVGGNSVWKELECIDMMIMWDHLKKAGAWYNINQELYNEIKNISPDFPEKFQGIDNLKLMLEDKPHVTNYLIEKYTKVLSQ